jgi:hypothetical protein
MVNEGMAALRGRVKVSSIVDEKPSDVLTGGKGSFIPFMGGGKRSVSGKSSGNAGSRGGQQRMDSSLESSEDDDGVEEEVLLEFVPGTSEVISQIISWSQS